MPKKHQHHSRLVGVRISGEERPRQIGVPDRAFLSFVCSECGEAFECEYGLVPGRGPFDPEARITVVNDPRKRGAAAQVFALYAKSPTVGAFLKNFAALDLEHKQTPNAHLRWDTRHGYITIA